MKNNSSSFSVLVLVAQVFAIVTCLSSCVSTFYGVDGKPRARIMGDLTIVIKANGDTTYTLKHSPVIQTSAQLVGTAGAFVTSTLITAR